jgi:lipopolysaccharide export system protein LptA
VLWQGDTTIRGDRLVLDRGRGDLLANGNVQSVFLLDGETSIGRGPRLRYDDVARQVTYASASPEATSSLAVARLSGPQGDLMAGEIQIQLATTGTAVEAIEAFSAVQLVLDARRADGDRLTFDAVTGRYTMRGVPGGPAVLTDTCRRTEGLSLTFVAKGEQVIVDGEQEVRTRTTDTPCPGPALP